MAVCSERANTFRPSSPEKVVSAMSVSATHMPVAEPLLPWFSSSS